MGGHSAVCLLMPPCPIHFMFKYQDQGFRLSSPSTHHTHRDLPISNNARDTRSFRQARLCHSLCFA
jgi:hypothetical protein